MGEKTQKIAVLSDGLRSSAQIAALVGLSPRYVRRVMQRLDLPRLGEGAQSGEQNHQYVAGRRVDPDGYVLITVPKGHPHARCRTSRGTKLMCEHRYVMEQTLGRHLRPEEVVDHIDGLTLHNAPENLRLFESNSAHLTATLQGRAPNLSAAGRRNTGTRTDLGQAIQRIDIYGVRRKRGDVRLRQILLAALKLGTSSPYLSGTSHHTRKAGIDMSSRSTIERALADLCARWEEDRTR